MLLSGKRFSASSFTTLGSTSLLLLVVLLVLSFFGQFCVHCQPYGPVRGGGLVDVDVQKRGFGKHVGVHVPLFYKMDLDKDPYHGKGLGINVLEGLVKVRVKKDPFAERSKVFVSLADVPLWMQRKR